MIDGALVLWMLALVLAVSALRRSTAESRTAFVRRRASASSRSCRASRWRSSPASCRSSFRRAGRPLYRAGQRLPRHSRRLRRRRLRPRRADPLLPARRRALQGRGGAAAAHRVPDRLVVFAFHRVLIYELTIMGWRFSACASYPPRAAAARRPAGHGAVAGLRDPLKDGRRVHVAAAG